MRGSSIAVVAWIAALAAALGGCWDEVKNVYDCNDCPDGSASSDGDADTDADSDADADGGPDGSVTSGQGDLPQGWEGFGASCETNADCEALGYPGEARCVHDVIGLINAPGGYCTACCNAEEIGGCAQNIDCVGANNVYLICLSHCDSDADCRQDGDWECREIYYIPDQFPGKFCLPVPELVQPDTDNLTDIDCPWPWL
jgi:hypothetical protein